MYWAEHSDEVVINHSLKLLDKSLLLLRVLNTDNYYVNKEQNNLIKQIEEWLGEANKGKIKKK